MFRFLGAFPLAVVAFAFMWASLVNAPHYQSPARGPPPAASSDPATLVRVTTSGEMLINTDWVDLVLKGARQDSEPALLRSRQNEDRSKSTGGTYRTLCVRVCDGFYFPISYSTSRERFASDAKQCERRCPTRSRLFVHRNPGEDVDDMVDLKGRLYRRLPTALLHRAQYVADCTCRGLPWDKEAIARHRVYAEAAKQTIPTKTAQPATAVRATKSAAMPQR